MYRNSLCRLFKKSRWSLTFSKCGGRLVLDETDHWEEAEAAEVVEACDDDEDDDDDNVE